VIAQHWRECAHSEAVQCIERVLAEDGAESDVTTASFPPGVAIKAAVVARRSGTCAALTLVDLFAHRDPRLAVSRAHGACDGGEVLAGATLATLCGPREAILSIERTLLNLLGLAMGCATLTAAFVDEVADTRAKICDTRKTIPGLRWLQKHAVLCGGGHLHRRGLDDAMLVKDNHVAGIPLDAFARSVEEVARTARARHPSLAFVCVECDSMEQFVALLALPRGAIDIALLDNFAVGELEDAVKRRDAAASSMLLEASGGVSLATVRAIARAGVDRISVGAITHSAPWHDVALDIDF